MPITEKKDERIRVSMYGQCELRVEGLMGDESDRLRAALTTGFHWVRRGEDGRLQSVPFYESLPAPEIDQEMVPFWGESDEPVQLSLFSFDDAAQNRIRFGSPSIFISHLCGYNYTPEGRTYYMERLESFGFYHMRSRRDPASGQHWEFWYLPGLWSAKGRFREHLNDNRTGVADGDMKIATKFLADEVIFGRLDIVVQCIAMVLE